MDVEVRIVPHVLSANYVRPMTRQNGKHAAVEMIGRNEGHVGLRSACLCWGRSLACPV